jgi:hypothetical protein
MFGRRNDNGVVEDVDERPVRIWSPAQIVAVVLGIGAIVFGALTLAATGLDLDNVADPHASVLSFHTTPLLGIAEIAWGALMVVAGLRPVAGRALMGLLGAVAVGLGAIVVLDAWPRRLHDELGVHDRNGWLLLAVGAVSLFAAFVLPVVSTPGQRTVRQRHVVGT